MGRTGCSRSRACIWLFSSTLSTSARLTLQDRAIISQVILEALSLGRLCSDKISHGTLAELRNAQKAAQAHLVQQETQGDVSSRSTQGRNQIRGWRRCAR